MVTDVERMQVVLDNPCILMTDQKIQSIDELTGVFSLIEKSRRPLLIIAEEVAPPVIMMLLSRRESDNFKVAAIIRRKMDIGARRCWTTSPSRQAAR